MTVDLCPVTCPDIEAADGTVIFDALAALFSFIILTVIAWLSAGA